MGNEQSGTLPSEAQLRSVEQTKTSNFNDPVFSSLSSPQTIAAHRRTVNACAFSSDDLRLASASSDRTVKLWNRAGDLLAEWKDLNGRVFDCHFSPDDQRLVFAAEGDCALLDLTCGKPFGLFTDHESWTDFFLSCRFNHRGDRIVSTSKGKGICLWDPRTTQPVLSLKNLYVAGSCYDSTSAEFHPDDVHLASCGTDRALHYWDLRAYQFPLRELNGFETPRCQFSPSGSHLMCGSTPPLWGVSVFDIATWIEVQVLPGHRHPVHSLTFADDGRCAITACYGSPLKVWDVQRGKNLCFLTGFDGRTRCSCAVRGQCVAYGAEDGTLRIWRVPFERLRTEPLPQHILDEVADQPTVDFSTCASATTVGPRNAPGFPIVNLSSASISASSRSEMDPIAVAEVALDVGECVVCYDRTPDTTLLPCRHLCLCGVCAHTLATTSTIAKGSQCPVCRQPIERAITNPVKFGTILRF